MTTLTQNHNLAQAYQTAVAANAAKRAAEAAAYRAILCGDDARHTPKVAAVAPALAKASPARIEEMSDADINAALFG